MNRGISVLLAAAVTLLAASGARAQLYRARDQNGRTIVTNLASGRSARPLTGGTVSVANAPGTEAPRLRLIATPGAVSALAERKVAPFRQHVRAAAARYTVPIRLLEAVIAVESDFNPLATSSKGAQGLMQLMPDTARDLAVADPYDPASNIDGGARYLRQMLDLFGQDVNLALAAYNSGPNTVRAAGGVPLIAETVEYVRKVRALFRGSLLGGGSSTLTSLRGGGGRLFLTNVGSTPSSLRVLRDPRGGNLLTNR